MPDTMPPLRYQERLLAIKSNKRRYNEQSGASYGKNWYMDVYQKPRSYERGFAYADGLYLLDDQHSPHTGLILTWNGRHINIPAWCRGGKDNRITLVLLGRQQSGMRDNERCIFR